MVIGTVQFQGLADFARFPCIIRTVKVCQCTIKVSNTVSCCRTGTIVKLPVGNQTIQCSLKGNGSYQSGIQVISYN